MIVWQRMTLIFSVAATLWPISCAFAGQADALQSCRAASTDETVVNDCIRRYTEGAEKHFSQVYTLAVKRAAAIDEIQQNNSKETVNRLEADQENWKRNMEAECDMHRLSAGGGNAGEAFYQSCLSQAYQSRAQDLQRGIQPHRRR